MLQDNLRNNTLISNIAGNLVRAGQHRPIVSPAGAVLKAQETNLHNNLMQTQDTRLKATMAKEVAEASLKEKQILEVNAALGRIAAGQSTFQQERSNLAQQGDPGKEAIEQSDAAMEMKWKRENFDDPNKNLTADQRLFKEDRKTWDAINKAEAEAEQKDKQFAPSPTMNLINERDALLKSGYPTEHPDVKALNSSIKKVSEIEEKGWPELSKVSALTGFIPPGRMTNAVGDMLESMIKARRAANLPEYTKENLEGMYFDAAKNQSTGRTAGGRLVIGRKQNVETGRQLLNDMKATVKELDYSNIDFVSAMDKWKRGQLQDPILTEYMNQRADLLFVLTNALKQNGVTDAALEVEMKAASEQMSPPAFAAYYNTQMRALNKVAAEMNEDYKFDLVEFPTVPAGQGGVGVPMLESERENPAGTTLTPGTIEDGYKFKGGDPGQQSNWEKM